MLSAAFHVITMAAVLPLAAHYACSLYQANAMNDLLIFISATLLLFDAMLGGRDT